MWRLDGDNKLENKAGSWKYHNKQFSIPIGSTKGFIFDKESGYILGKKRVDDLFSKEIVLSVKFKPKLEGIKIVLLFSTFTTKFSSHFAFFLLLLTCLVISGEVSMNGQGGWNFSFNTRKTG